MTRMIVHSPAGVTLVGGGALNPACLAEALTLAPLLAAADSGADRVLALGHRPQAVIGDLDSISDQARGLLDGRIHHVGEQDSTDFEKCLTRIAAPFVLALGFVGPRLDHTMAVFNALTRARLPCLVLGDEDVTFLAPPELALELPVGTRLSLFPMGGVTGESRGLRWPIEGIPFAPDGLIGTSNITTAPQVRLAFSAPRMLVMLPRPHLAAALRALDPGGR